MSLNTWTRSGSEKAQQSQTIRILMKTLQYLAEDAVNDESREKSFIKVASTIINDTFNPSSNFSINEQVSVVFSSMGWKNTQLTLTSAEDAEILLGSNRHLDQDPDSVDGLRILIKTLSIALGSYLFDREVSASVDVDIHTGPTYRVKLRALKKLATQEKKIEAEALDEKPEMSPTQTSTTTSSASVGKSVTSGIETSQIFLPVLSNKLSTSRLHLVLQDVIVEFCKSWHGENPLDRNDTGDESDNITALITYLTQKNEESNTSNVEVGSQIGTYFAQTIVESYPGEQLLSQEILDGSAVGSIIRDIKARAFCYLKPGEKCGPEIGGTNREICDFAMGLWQGCLSNLSENKKFEFSGFYPAGRRDPYCLMEFEVNSI